MQVNPSSPGVSASLQSCLRAIESALRGGDVGSAMRAAAAGAARGFRHPQLLTLAAHERLAAGDAETALRLAEDAARLAPRMPEARNAAGLALMQLGRAREALGEFAAALRAAPKAAMIHFHKGDAHESLSELAEARAAYEAALAIQPIYPEALARLAYLAALSGDWTAARAQAARALEQNPREAVAHLALAMGEIEEKDFAAALKRAQALAADKTLGPVNRAIAEGLVGDAEAGLGRFADAFAAYRRSNEMRRATAQAVYEAEGRETALARAQRLDAYFRAAPAGAWKAERTEPHFKPHAKSPLRTHVFLIGFPRSGTTLLEQILASHGEVTAMDERDGLTAAFADFVMADGGLDRLAQLSGAALDPWRKAYWKYAAQCGFAPERAVFIDKMPLNTVLLPLIAKLFPRSKILFALRDPRDVVLSCFRRRFGMSAQMYELLTLEGAARYYDAVMRLAEVYRDLLGLDTHTVRYEDVVADFEGETRKLCGFLGLAWDEAMRDFAARTRARKINTPSAAQVARGLYSEGQGQWRAWREQMAPVLPMLAPWAAHFGYEEN